MLSKVPLDEVVSRIRGEFLEMPGLSLTLAQAQRLWGLDRRRCAALLNVLVKGGFLFRTREGTFVRYDVSSPVH